MKMKIVPISILMILMLCSATMAQDLYVTQKGFPAAMSKETLSKFIEIWNVDKAAGNKMIASGDVIVLKAGIEVFMMDIEILSGFAKIRPKGKTLELWTMSKALKKK